jgi:hypothetical protein
MSACSSPLAWLVAVPHSDGQHIHHPIEHIFNDVQGVGGHLSGTVYFQLWFVPWGGFEGLMGV